MRETCQVFEGSSKCNRPAIAILKQEMLASDFDYQRLFGLRFVKGTLT